MLIGNLLYEISNIDEYFIVYTIITRKKLSIYIVLKLIEN